MRATVLAEAPAKAPEPTSNPPERSDWVASLRDEIDDYYQRLKSLGSQDSSMVMLEVSAISARAYELRLLLHRLEGRAAQAIRAREVEPLIEACDLQFKIHSRLASIRRDEWEMSRV